MTLVKRSCSAPGATLLIDNLLLFNLLNLTVLTQTNCKCIADTSGVVAASPEDCLHLLGATSTAVNYGGLQVQIQAPALLCSSCIFLFFCFWLSLVTFHPNIEIRMLLEMSQDHLLVWGQKHWLLETRWLCPNCESDCLKVTIWGSWCHRTADGNVPIHQKLMFAMWPQNGSSFVDDF